MKKVFWAIVIVFVLVLIIAVAVVTMNLDRIVKSGVETYGPQITKVSVTLDGMHIGLTTGSAKIKGLVVGNPDGYKAPEAIRIGTASVGVNSFSILSDKIVVRSIKVESPEITFEGGLGGNNLSAIMDNVNGAAKKSDGVVTNSTGQPKPAKKIEVDDFVITGAKVHVILTQLGGREMTLSLPEVHLTNLGKGSDGLTPAELTRVILNAIITETTKAVGSEISNLGLTKGVQQLKQGVGKSIGNLFKK